MHHCSYPLYNVNGALQIIIIIIIIYVITVPEPYRQAVTRIQV